VQVGYPNAKIAVLYLNDDFGREYVSGLKEGLGDQASKMIVAEASYELTDPTIDSQILKLKASGADLFYDIAGTKAAAQAIRKMAEIGWKPLHILNGAAATVASVVQSAGLENSKDVVSVGYSKDPLDSTWKDDTGVKIFLSFMEKYYPEGDKTTSLPLIGYNGAQLMIDRFRKFCTR